MKIRRQIYRLCSHTGILHSGTTQAYAFCIQVLFRKVRIDWESDFLSHLHRIWFWIWIQLCCADTLFFFGGGGVHGSGWACPPPPPPPPPTTTTHIYVVLIILKKGIQFFSIPNHRSRNGGGGGGGGEGNIEAVKVFNCENWFFDPYSSYFCKTNLRLKPKF